MDGPPPGIDLSETQVPRLLAVTFATFALATIAVVLRFVSRRLVHTYLWWDDWLIVVAWVFDTALCLFLPFYMLPHGYGKHLWVGPSDAALGWAIALFLSEPIYICILCTVKFSLLAFYWRLFKQTTIIRIPIYTLATVVSCWGIASILISIFQCTPVHSFWDRFSPIEPIPGHCGVDVKKFFCGNSIPNILTDAAMIILPIPFVWKLQLPLAQKIALTGIFILGIFVTGVSITRLAFIVNVNLASPDITWNFVNTQIWTTVEIHVGIVCACLPSLRPLLTLALTGSATRGNTAAAGNPGVSTAKSRLLRSVGSKPQHTTENVEEDQNYLFSRSSETEYHELAFTKASG